MEHGDYDSDPFSSDGLWRLSKFTIESIQPLEPLPWNEELPDLSEGVFKSAFDLFGKDETRLHELDVFGTDLFEPSVFGESTITDTSSEGQHETSISAQNPDDDLEDIWALDNNELSSSSLKISKSWEKYHHRQFSEPPSAHFSESGAKGFDAAIGHQHRHANLTSLKSVARNDVYIQSLFRAGLGWGSLLFRYNEQQQKFERTIEDVRISGLSVQSLSGLADEVLQCGNNMQRVRSFIQRVPREAAEPSALSAFSTAASVIIYTLEKQLLATFKLISSVLQIRSLFQQPGELVGALANMMDAVEKAGSEARIISSVFKMAAHYSQIHGPMEDLFREIVFKVVGPWLTHVESWIGFRPETSTSVELLTSGRSFVFLEKHEAKDKLRSRERVDYVYLPEQMPSFVPPDQAHLIYESGRSLRLLRRLHPHHPLASDRPRADISSLSCAGTWAELERIQAKARDYESRLREEVLKYNSGDLSDPETRLDSTEISGPQDISDMFDIFDIDDPRNVTGLLANESSLEKENIGQLLASTKEQPAGVETNFAPEVTSSLYLSLAPLLSSQALLIDFSCLHLLFKEHRLRDHLALQWRFQLLGDGYFTSRLSHSLFNPEMESGERKTGVVRSGVHTGLRLGSRDTWPPASSELRLVLMGILNECYYGEYADGSGNPEFDKEKELPGGLSFSIRELTEKEIAKCKDPNAIEALDFLRLQYKPSNVLEAIITERSLTKYDHLFKRLLRLLRMVSVVKGLIRDSTARDSLSGDTRNILQKFRVDCQHFVLALSDYCFQLGIGSTWQQFQESLVKIESCLDRGDIDGTIEAAHSIPRLRAYHEDTLDRMMFALFLGTRHTEVAKLLDAIFDTILKFAPLSRLDGVQGVRHKSETVIRRLYAMFRKQTSAFVGYLRGLDGARAAAPPKSLSRSRSGTAFAKEGPINVFDHLLVRLDMKRYY